jgi:hypothetical protein
MQEDSILKILFSDESFDNSKISIHLLLIKLSILKNENNVSHTKTMKIALDDYQKKNIIRDIRALVRKGFVALSTEDLNLEESLSEILISLTDSGRDEVKRITDL